MYGYSCTYCIYPAYVKGLPLSRLPMILEEKEKENGGERKGGRNGVESKHVEDTPSSEEKVHLEKSNILLLGPTGSGKYMYIYMTRIYMYVEFNAAAELITED